MKRLATLWHCHPASPSTAAGCERTAPAADPALYEKLREQGTFLSDEYLQLAYEELLQQNYLQARQEMQSAESPAIVAGAATTSGVDSAAASLSTTQITSTNSRAGGDSHRLRGSQAHSIRANQGLFYGNGAVVGEALAAQQSGQNVDSIGGGLLAGMEEQGGDQGVSEVIESDEPSELQWEEFVQTMLLRNL